MDIQTTPFNYPGTAQVLTAAQAVPYVLDNAGATFPKRDTVDQKLVAEVRTWGRSGTLIDDEADFGGPGSISGGTKPTDSDGDGIPDAWESANGLNPQDPSDAMKISSSGYANIERYLNSLVP
jgi:hypothetical protein